MGAVALFQVADGLPATPPGLVKSTPGPFCQVRVAQASVPVRAANPDEPSPSSAARSLASAKVGSPATPPGFAIVRPAAGGCSVRVAQVFSAVRAASPAP